ncbi:oligosaccharide flippase family protein [Methylicorpusculum sp.]|uniref:oligosaccharide flippase family protein n=1 Tax=Methylicorpusculum sp. TaxID=2713644 RepID=UPI002ABCD1CB|nr:oligosaccharide flippase family protein [Methylicorpusculum sp.]MDZ4150991.1 oligosaccharide flippase family protein [Methylicorpusculum sp.]
MSNKRNAIWSMAGGGAPAVAALISIPVLIYYLGYELFVITSLLISLTIFFYIYDFGIGRAMTYFLPAQDQNQNSINHLIFSGLCLGSLLGIVTSAIAYFTAPLFVARWMVISPDLIEETANAFQLLSLGILPSILATVVRGALEGLSEFRIANFGKILSGTSIFIFPLLLVVGGIHDVESIALAIFFTRVIALFYFAYLLLKVSPFKFSKPSFQDIERIVKYTKWAAIGGFLSTMFVYGDRFIVSRYLDSESLAVYIFSQDILIRFLLIPWAMANVLMPLFVAGSQPKGTFIAFYEKQHKKIKSWSLLIAIMIVLGLYAFLRIPTDIELSSHLFDVVLIQVIGIFFCALSQLPLIYLYAKGKPKAISLMYMLEALIYVAIAPTIFKEYGLYGACFIWTGRLIIEYFLLQTYTKRIIRCS